MTARESIRVLSRVTQCTDGALVTDDKVTVEADKDGAISVM